MKKTIKTIATVFAGIAITLSLSTSCKKAEKGDTGPTGATGSQGQSGPQAKTFNFNLTFVSGDTFKNYTGITGFDPDDVILTYAKYETLGTTDYWVALPAVIGTVNFIPEFSDVTGNGYINTLKSNGTSGSPWTSTNTFAFKIVLIKSAQRLANPNVNYKDYNAVKKVFSLKD